MERLADIGAELIKARRANGITQRELGRRLGVSQPQVARWEASVYQNVALERVDAVAEVLGVHPRSTPRPLAVAEASAVYATTLPHAEPEALRALSRTGVSPRAIVAFARSHNVERLDLFGSVLRTDFGPESDVDVLVTYDPGGTPSLLGAADHETELGAIFRRTVDLVSRPGIERSENAVRREEILGDARMLYAKP